MFIKVVDIALVRPAMCPRNGANWDVSKIYSLRSLFLLNARH